jgi:hypothetical protein
MNSPTRVACSVWLLLLAGLGGRHSLPVYTVDSQSMSAAGNQTARDRTSTWKSHPGHCIAGSLFSCRFHMHKVTDPACDRAIVSRSRGYHSSLLIRVPYTVSTVPYRIYRAGARHTVGPGHRAVRPAFERDLGH